MKNTSIEHFKKTKILATIGPATNSYEKVCDLLEAGLNGFRLNFSHGTNDEKAKQIEWIRKASLEIKKPAAIVADLHGPKMAMGKLDGVVEVKKDHILKLALGGNQSKGILPTQYDISRRVKPGERLMIFDGSIETIIKSVNNGVVEVEVKNDGKIISGKGINLPDTDLQGDVITQKDYDDTRFALEMGVDYIAQSFVQSADDVMMLKNFMQKINPNASLIAKVETKAATNNLVGIVKAADGVMVARGDLAVETLPESVPIVQRKIIGLCQHYAKISIVATQMLASMTANPEPTRAEVSDVATAVIVGADCVMLSEETAVGEYPIEAVEFMKRIIKYTEDNSPVKPLFLNEEDSSVQSALSSAVMTLAHQVEAVAIVTETASGKTAKVLASHRPNMPIIMVTDKPEVAQQLALVYGGKSFVRETQAEAGEKMTDWLRERNILKHGDVVVITSGKYPGQVGGTDTIKIRRIQ